MGYSTHPNAIERVKDFLEQLVKSDETIQWQSSNPRYLGYCIREALNVAEKLDIPEYKELRKRFRFREKVGVLVAERKTDDALFIARMAETPTPIQHRTFTHNYTKALHVVGTVMANRAAKTFSFNLENPLPTEEIQKLEKWCNSNEYTVTTTGNELTIRKNE